MKQFIVLVVAAIACSCSFANFQSSSSAKISPLDGLRTAWQKEQTMHATAQDKNDITIVYGGADISRNPAISQPIVIA